MTAVASDDGVPEPKAAASRTPVNYNAWGLRVAWFVYRGPGAGFTFEPEQFKVYTDYRGNSPWTPGWELPPLPADGKFPVTTTFTVPGTYVLRVLAHDGGLITNADVTVTVQGCRTERMTLTPSRTGLFGVALAVTMLSSTSGQQLVYLSGQTGRWCADAGRPTRFKPSSPSPTDAVRDGSAKLGHPVQNVTREHGLTPLPR